MWMDRGEGFWTLHPQPCWTAAYPFFEHGLLVTSTRSSFAPLPSRTRAADDFSVEAKRPRPLPARSELPRQWQSQTLMCIDPHKIRRATDFSVRTASIREGLVVIRVHTPEFAFEKNIAKMS
jgi:hypothetical protein